MCCGTGSQLSFLSMRSWEWDWENRQAALFSIYWSLFSSLDNVPCEMLLDIPAVCFRCDEDMD